VTLDDLLAGLRKEYIASIPERLILLQHLLNCGELSELQDSFHKLKGSGTTYGLPEISMVAGLAEEICRDQQNQAPKAIPLLIELLAEIYQRRNAEQSFDVATDPRFSQVKLLRT
jgi:HPt (histidine-containing phosphotransfer) domain-containing protein